MAFLEVFNKIETPNELVKRVLREEIEKALLECSESQRSLFKKIFPKGVQKESEEILKSALDLCHRTIAKNTENPERVSASTQKEILP